VAISSAPPDGSVLNSEAGSAGHATRVQPQVAASRTAHRSARDARSPLPRQSRFSRSANAGRAEGAGPPRRPPRRASGETRHSGGTLTPPAADTGDPFARRAAER
jgi:hypothetical protein